MAGAVENFLLSALQIDVAAGKWTPKHEIVPCAPAGVAPSLLPRLIASEDAMVKYIGAAPGQIVRITRPSPTAGVVVVYKLVV